MEQVKWFDRNFDFTKTQNIFPEILERLAGTPARLDEKLAQLSPVVLTKKPGGAWSIQEHLGHLSDLEPLWQQRYDDIVTGQECLRPTDLQNRKTDLAGHNDRALSDLLRRFRELRGQTLAILTGIDEEMIFRSALHPRLRTPMRTMDHFLFVAEHDDHHLARMSELVKLV